MTKIYVGTINSFHGIKGDLKILSDFEMKEKVYKKNSIIYIDGIKHVITSSKIHKNNYLITIDNLFDINKVNDFLKKDIYIDREDLNLTDGEYLVNDLIDFDVYDENYYIGKVYEIRYSVNSKILCIVANKNIFIPLLDNFINSIDFSSKKIYTNNGKEFIL